VKEKKKEKKEKREKKKIMTSTLNQIIIVMSDQLKTYSQA
jgi:hypothetical protein